MPDRIEEIKARLAKATPGPWVWDGDPVQPDALFSDTAEVTIFEAVDAYNNAAMRWPGQNRVADQAFIAHAPEDIAYLLAELETARAALAGAADDAASREAYARWQGRTEAGR